MKWAHFLPPKDKINKLSPRAYKPDNGIYITNVHINGLWYPAPKTKPRPNFVMFGHMALKHDFNNEFLTHLWGGRGCYVGHMWVWCLLLVVFSACGGIDSMLVLTAYF